MFTAGRDQIVGETVDGKYELTRYIGAGSFAVVYEAAEVFAGQHVGRVAIKLIEPQDGDQQTGLVREIQALAQLSHAHVLTYRTSGVVQSGRLGGAFYIVTELAEHSLADALSKGNGSGLAQEVCLHVSSALAYLHSRGAVHRDVKPANILRVGDVWKLADFGLARGVSGTFATASGRKGTLGYMAPEMLDGQVGPSSDIYSLGVTLLECLTKRLAHDGTTEGEFLRNLLTRPASIPSGLPEPWRDALPACLAREPPDRCSAAQLVSVLSRSPARSHTVLAAGVPSPAPQLPVPAGPRAAAPRPAPTVPARGAVAPSRPREREGTRVGEEIEGPDGGVYVWVPPGEFMMGSNDGYADEQPVHNVRITRGFWLGKHQVTNAQYRRFCEATRREFPSRSGQGDNHPVVCVSWGDAQAYCDHHDLGLPTEAEWEYGARGPQGRQYPWGDDWSADSCCHIGNYGPDGATFPVGSLWPDTSWCGAQDMAGNVNEWVADWYDAEYYSQSPTEDPMGPASGQDRVLRGGSWVSSASDCSSACRNWLDPGARLDYNGFRCVVRRR